MKDNKVENKTNDTQLSDEELNAINGGLDPAVYVRDLKGKPNKFDNGPKDNGDKDLYARIGATAGQTEGSVKGVWPPW